MLAAGSAFGEGFLAVWGPLAKGCEPLQGSPGGPGHRGTIYPPVLLHPRSDAPFSSLPLHVFPIIQRALRLARPLMPITGMQHRLFLGGRKAASISWIRGDLVGRGRAQDLPFLCDSQLPGPGEGPFSQKMERWCQVGGCCRALWGHADSRVFLDSWHPFCSSSHPQGAALHPVVVTSMFWCSLGLQSGQKPHQK